MGEVRSAARCWSNIAPSTRYDCADASQDGERRGDQGTIRHRGGADLIYSPAPARSPDRRRGQYKSESNEMADTKDTKQEKQYTPDARSIFSLYDIFPEASGLFET